MPTSLSHAPLQFLSALGAAATLGTVYLATLSIPTFAYAIYRTRRQPALIGWIGFVVGVLAFIVVSDRDAAQEILKTSLGLVYYLLASPLVFQMCRPVASGRLPKDILFCIIFVIYLCIPTVLFRALDLMPAIVVGWFMMLSSYSYCVDGCRRGSPSLQDFIFFIFVDPSLSLPDRALAQTSRPDKGIWMRQIIIASASVVVGLTILTSFQAFADATDFGSQGWAIYSSTVMRSSVMFLSFFWLRAGIADLRIAMLSSLGFAVPKAYERPYLAGSPREFWMRWNLYVGRWSRRYIFTPVALSIARHQRWRHLGFNRLPQIVGVLLTFIVIGFLHDALNFVGEGRSYGAWLMTFLAAASGLLCWEGILVIGRSIGRRCSLACPGWLSLAIGRLAVLHYIAMIIVLTGRL